ncbi:MAG: glycosyltransferase family 2 protein [Candidatus Pacearchaeota archaeon]|jgi:glycosyltransferase involved in cell wall biosynthesis
MVTQRGLVYSVVVPMKDEAGNIPQLDMEIKEVMSKLGSYEIIYVNDGSRDNTLAELKKLKKVKIINFNRNYGQAIATDAGFKEAKGDIIITLDGDLQNDPKDIPRLLNELKEKNLDVVAGWRKNRKDKGGIKLLSRFGHFLRKSLIQDPVHDTGCTLRVYKKEAAKSLDLWGDMHRYILALLKWKGFTIGELEVNHRERTAGKTKYGYGKATRGFIDLLYIWFIQKYSSRPLHIFGYLSFFLFIAGIISGLWSLYQRIFQGLSLNRNGWFFLAIAGITAAVLFFSFGLIMDLLIRMQLNISDVEKRYYIRDVIVT